MIKGVQNLKMVDSTAGGSTAAGLGTKKQETVPYETKNRFVVSAKPLDFSFMKIQQVARKFYEV